MTDIFSRHFALGLASADEKGAHSKVSEGVLTTIPLYKYVMVIEGRCLIQGAKISCKDEKL